MATKLGEEDEVLCVGFVKENLQIVLQSSQGYFLRFAAGEIPVKKKAAVGVRAMKLGDGDYIEEVYLFENRMEKTVLYHEKELALHKLRAGGRDQKGTKVRK